MFYPKTHSRYDESFDLIPAAEVLKGQPEQLRDVFGFWFADSLVFEGGSLTEQTFVYRMAQVEADKITGSGEEILALERVYAVVAQAHFITAHPTGTPGVDYYFCGWAKYDAAASDTTVVINFDGTRWDEDI
jgi:hypothetical protein